MDPFGVGFSMGLIVGEGSFTGDQRQPALQIRMHRRDVDALDLVQRELGGQVFGPYAHDGRHSCVYMLRGSALRAALPVIEQSLPPSWKRAQFESWRAKYADYFDRPEPSRNLLERVERLLPSEP